jgi:enoyl-CoA hydratase/carnithine racemase
MDNGAMKLEWLEAGVALATMIRPDERNSLVLELLDSLEEALALCRKTRARVLILTGSGSSFCAGAHLKYFTDPQSPIGTSAYEIRDNYLSRVSSLFDTIEEMPFITVAAINGYALGGGFELALACDFRLMSSSAKAGLPEVVLGATPNSGGVQKLHRFVGRAKALEWILLGRHLSAADLDRWGMLFAVCEPGALIEDAMQLARSLKELSPQGLAQAKASIYIAEDCDIRTARRAGIEALTSLIGREDWTEGMRAFVEKRKPHFQR